MVTGSSDDSGRAVEGEGRGGGLLNVTVRSSLGVPSDMGLGTMLSRSEQKQDSK